MKFSGIKLLILKYGILVILFFMIGLALFGWFTSLQWKSISNDIDDNE